MIGSANTRGEGVKRLAQAVVGGTFGRYIARIFSPRILNWNCACWAFCVSFSAAKMSGSLAEMVRKVAGPGLGGLVASPLTGAAGDVAHAEISSLYQC